MWNSRSSSSFSCLLWLFVHVLVCVPSCVADCTTGVNSVGNAATVLIQDSVNACSTNGFMSASFVGLKLPSGGGAVTITLTPGDSAGSFLVLSFADHARLGPFVVGQSSYSYNIYSTGVHLVYLSAWGTINNYNYDWLEIRVEASTYPGTLTCYYCAPPAGWGTGWPPRGRCHAGSFINMTALDSTGCSVCPIGYAQNSSESTTCVACPAGSFTNTTGSTSCSLCPLGTYSNTIGASSCTPCPPGISTNTTGSTSCSWCPAGSYHVTSSTCLPCMAGTYSQADATSCTPCPVGTYSQAGATSCIPCNAGNYTDTTGNDQCYRCPINTFSNTNGATSCTPCPSGQVSGLGTTSCCLPTNDVTTASVWVGMASSVAAIAGAAADLRQAQAALDALLAGQAAGQLITDQIVQRAQDLIKTKLAKLAATTTLSLATIGLSIAKLSDKDLCNRGTANSIDVVLPDSSNSVTGSSGSVSGVALFVFVPVVCAQALLSAVLFILFRRAKSNSNKNVQAI